MRVIAAVVATAWFACGDNHAVEPDAMVDAPPDAKPARERCWTVQDRVPSTAASVTLGTGSDAFEAMPAVLPLAYGSQDGYNFVVNVRMTGLSPGNPDDVLDPANPRTRIRAFFDDTGLPLNYYSYCPWRNGYVPVGDGTYELSAAAALIFETCWRASHLVGRPIRIELEILDQNGVYATDVKVVTAGPAPTAPENDIGPGCEHPLIKPGLVLRDP